jgi:hypothetical protein
MVEPALRLATVVPRMDHAAARVERMEVEHARVSAGIRHDRPVPRVDLHPVCWCRVILAVSVSRWTHRKVRCEEGRHARLPDPKTVHAQADDLLKMHLPVTSRLSHCVKFRQSLSQASCCQCFKSELTPSIATITSPAIQTGLVRSGAISDYLLRTRQENLDKSVEKK